MEKLSPLNPVRNLHISSCLKAKTVLNKYASGFWCYNRRCTFSLEEALLWIMDSNFAQKWRFKVKNPFIRNLFLKNKQLLASQDIHWWTGVDYCDVFISCLDSHSDGTHSLQRIHCWTSDGMLHFSTSVAETNSFTSWMAWGWGHFQQIFLFVSVSLWCRYPTFSFLLLSVACRLQNS